MRYALLINELPGSYEQLDDAERAAITAEYVALLTDQRILGGERLQPADTATTVRDAGGETVLTDGPFADTKEIFGGFYLVEAPDLDSALELAVRLPTLPAGHRRGPPDAAPLHPRRPHLNTRMVQIVLAEPKWSKKLTDADRRGLSALFWSHLNLYGKFELDMSKQLDLGPDLASPDREPGSDLKVQQPT